MIILKKRLAGISESALSRFLGRAKRAAGVQKRVTVLVAGDRELRELNRRFRAQDRAADVLSFPAGPDGDRGQAGELAISADRAAANARRLGHAAASELKILILHGLLHLAGYDHERDTGRMARRETSLRRELGLPEALLQRAARAARRS